jgi:hypothetical protein
MCVRYGASLPISLLVLMAALPFGNAQQSDYPVMDKVAQKVIEKYQNSTCEDLRAQNQQPPDPQQDAMKQKIVALLRSDPKMRHQFLNKVAAPIADKLLQCGMIP